MASTGFPHATEYIFLPAPAPDPYLGDKNSLSARAESEDHRLRKDLIEVSANAA
jgi:hypothetical protein